MELPPSTLWLEPPPVEANATAEQLSHPLSRFNDLNGAPYVHNRPLSFANDKAKGRWYDYIPDAAGRDTFTAFWCTNHSSKTTWLGLVSSYTRNDVANPHWDELPWHVWGVALIAPKTGNGKHLIIWDCDPRLIQSENSNHTTKRPREFLLSIQVDFLKTARRRGKLASLWYNTDTTYSNQNRCLQYTIQWIYNVASFGDQPLITNAEGDPADPRLQGCTRISRF